MEKIFYAISSRLFSLSRPDFTDAVQTQGRSPCAPTQGLRTKTVKLQSLVSARDHLHPSPHRTTSQTKNEHQALNCFEDRHGQRAETVVKRNNRQFLLEIDTVELLLLVAKKPAYQLDEATKI